MQMMQRKKQHLTSRSRYFNSETQNRFYDIFEKKGKNVEISTFSWWRWRESNSIETVFTSCHESSRVSIFKVFFDSMSP